MYCTFNVTPSEELQSVCSIHCDSSILGFDPFPFASGMVANLESCNRLAEEQRNGSEVYVAAHSAPITMGT